MASLLDRMIRAAKLDTTVYEEVEHDPNATGQAMTVVILSSLAPALSGLIHGGVVALVFTTIAAILGWVVWAILTYFIGTRFLPEPQTKADLGEMLRTTAFSSAPGVICVLGLIPIPGLLPLSISVALLWIVVAMVIAVRQALDYQSLGRAIAVCVIALLIVLFFGWLTEPNPFVGTAL